MIMNAVHWVTANWAAIGVAILAVLGAFSAIAKLTPTQSDDKIVEFLYKIIHTLGLTK